MLLIPTLVGRSKQLKSRKVCIPVSLRSGLNSTADLGDWVKWKLIPSFLLTGSANSGSSIEFNQSHHLWNLDDFKEQLQAFLLPSSLIVSKLTSQVDEMTYFYTATNPKIISTVIVFFQVPYWIYPGPPSTYLKWTFNMSTSNTATWAQHPIKAWTAHLIPYFCPSHLPLTFPVTVEGNI